MKSSENTSKIRIKDIAKQAGVSTGTVDRVLHNRSEVREATRKKVLAIVEEMGYTPNLMARSLASKKTARIAVLFPDPDEGNPYWKQPINGLKRAQEELKDYNIDIELTTFKVREDAFIKATNQVLEELPDAVVFNPVFREATLAFIETLEKHEIPYVLQDTHLRNTNAVAYFGQEATQSGMVAAKLMRYALKKNDKVLTIMLTHGSQVTHHLQARVDGFKRFFEGESESNISVISENIDLSNTANLENTLTRVLEAHSDASAVFVPNSRVFHVASYMKKGATTNLMLIGYDLIDENINYLEAGTIDFLIGQKPQEQAYAAVFAAFNYIMKKQEAAKVNFMPIDVIMKENIQHYKR